METWALIYNPASGSFRPDTLESIGTVLRGEGIRLRLLPTCSPGHATELARDAQGVACVAVYGGDGTFSEVANGLLGRDIPLAFLPGGTTNVMAWELGLDMDPVRAALAQARGRPAPVWPGMLGERCFLLMAGFGFDGRAVREVSPRMKGVLGKGAYVLAAIGAWPRSTAIIRVTTPDGECLSGSWVVAARSAHYGGRYVVHPRAGLGHPRLGLVVVQQLAVVPFVACHLGLGWHRPGPGVTLGEHSALRIESDREVHVQVDGDYYGSGREFAVRLASRPLLVCGAPGCPPRA